MTKGKASHSLFISHSTHYPLYPSWYLLRWIAIICWHACLLPRYVRGSWGQELLLILLAFVPWVFAELTEAVTSWSLNSSWRTDQGYWVPEVRVRGFEETQHSSGRWPDSIKCWKSSISTPPQIQSLYFSILTVCSSSLNLRDYSLCSLTSSSLFCSANRRHWREPRDRETVR